jgi:Holliday junction resolvase YEN1
LLNAAKRYHDDIPALTEFLFEWREELRTLLRTDPDGHIGRRCVAIADKVDKSFPDCHVVLAYTQPTTSWSHDGSGADAMPTTHMQKPDLHGLASFCTRRFGWGPQTLHEKFKHVVWDGACLRMLCQVTGFFFFFHVQLSHS